MRKDAVVLPTMTMTTTSCDNSVEGDGLVTRKGGITVTYKSWLMDINTNVPSSSKVDLMTTQCDYGNERLRQSVGLLFFAGTETSRGNGVVHANVGHEVTLLTFSLRFFCTKTYIRQVCEPPQHTTSRKKHRDHGGGAACHSSGVHCYNSPIQTHG
jgi:hypothetical protein